MVEAFGLKDCTKLVSLKSKNTELLLLSVNARESGAKKSLGHVKNLFAFVIAPLTFFLNKLSWTLLSMRSSACSIKTGKLVTKDVSSFSA